MKILITGASSGIGASTAQCLAETGATLVLHGRDSERLDAVRSKLNGDGHSTLIGELTDWMETPTSMPSLPALDGIVWSAGICELSPAMMLSAKKLRATLAVNVEAPLLILSWLYRKKILADNARILLVGSSAAHEAGPGFTAYAASKGALTSAARVMDKEFAARGVRVHCIEPPTVLTPMTQKLFDTFKSMEASLEQAPIPAETVAQQIRDWLLTKLA
jgi:NAD(P)-dependent dehydrogenase (short-subunit alcohol dehydrogenase family)